MARRLPMLKPKRGASAAAAANLPAVLDGTVLPMSAEFDRGVDGGLKLPFRTIGGDVNGIMSGWGVGGTFGAGIAGTQGSRHQRQGPKAAEVSADLLTSDPVIASLVRQKLTSLMGVGLQFSSRVDWKAIGLRSEDEARDLQTQIDRNWKAWAASPLEADYTGRNSLHELASQAVTSYLLTGEIVATIDWVRDRSKVTGTCISILDSRQLDYTKTMESEDGGCVNGVQFDKRGRLKGYWIRKAKYGALINQPMPVYVSAYTSFRRPRVLHIFDAQLPGQTRGVSPLIAALSPAAERSMLSTATLEKAVIDAQVAATLKSDMPEEIKFGGLATQEGATQGIPLQGMTAQFAADPIAGRAAWWESQKLSLKPGTIASLAPGEELNFHTSATPGNNFDVFNNSLIRQTARAAGESYEAVSGNFEKSSFSASRLALEIPRLQMLVERHKIVEKFYSAAFTAWLEEEIYADRIKLPKHAAPYWACPDAYTGGMWRGQGKISPDPKKQADADVILLANQLTTRRELLSDRGLDFEETMESLSHENARMIELGLDPKVAGTVTTQMKFVTEEDDIIESKAPSNAKPKAPK